MEMLNLGVNGIIMETILGHGLQLDITGFAYRSAKMMARVKS